MGARWWRFLRQVLPLAALSLVLAGCGNAHQSVFNPAGPVAQRELDLVVRTFWIMAIVMVFTFGAFFYAIIKFRQRPGNEELPKQVKGNHRLEIMWTAIPAILLVIIAVPTVSAAFYAHQVPTGPKVLNVTVVGHQFWWEFDYPGLGIVTADDMHVPVGTKISMKLQSADVLHSLWAPALFGKTDSVPGRTNTLWFEASKAGTYPGQCAEFCGAGHADMRFKVIAQSPADFQKWVATMKKPFVPPTSATAKQGMSIFKTDCSACHVIDGAPFKMNAVGPNLTNFASRTGIAGDMMNNNRENLILWLHNPPAVLPGSKMPDLHLKPSQVTALAAFLRGLK